MAELDMTAFQTIQNGIKEINKDGALLNGNLQATMIIVKLKELNEYISKVANNAGSNETDTMISIANMMMYDIIKEINKYFHIG